MYLRETFAVVCVISLGILLASAMRDPVDTLPREDEANTGLGYPLFDPEMAPADKKELVMRGYHIMLDTRKHLPEYAGDKISCTNCHFSAGNSFGGRSNGFSLVGVAHKYPKTLPTGEPYTLAERINSCFLRSLNGKQLPLDHPDMQAMVAYLDWISSGVPKRTAYPWTGVKDLRTKHVPNPENGAKIYAMQCALCHGKNGEGQEIPNEINHPPLWGKNSFNDDAGMTNIQTFAYFIYENMPYNEPKLTVEEALDVAAFVISQPRPKFVPPEK